MGPGPMGQTQEPMGKQTQGKNRPNPGQTDIFLPEKGDTLGGDFDKYGSNPPRDGSEEVRLEKLVPRDAIKSSGASILSRLWPKTFSKLVKRHFQGGGKKTCLVVCPGPGPGPSGLGPGPDKFWMDA